MPILTPPDMPAYEAFKSEAKSQIKSDGGWVTKMIYVVPTTLAILALVFTISQGVLIGIGSMLIGAALGYLIYRFGILGWAISNKAGQAYKTQWAQKMGWTYHETGISIPHGNPLHDRGDKHDVHDGFSFTYEGMRGGVCNFTVINIVETTDSDGDRDTREDKDLYTLTWLAVELPVESMELANRSWGDNRFFDSMDSKFSHQKVVELESAEFHKKFKLQMADTADDMMIRQVFTPSVLDGFITGAWRLNKPLVYMNGHLWVFEKKHYDADQLNEDLNKVLVPLDELQVTARSLFSRTQAQHS